MQIFESLFHSIFNCSDEILSFTWCINLMIVFVHVSPYCSTENSIEPAHICSKDGTLKINTFIFYSVTLWNSISKMIWLNPIRDRCLCAWDFQFSTLLMLITYPCAIVLMCMYSVSFNFVVVKSLYKWAEPDCSSTSTWRCCIASTHSSNLAHFGVSV